MNKKVYIYDSHIGGLYVRDEDLDYDYLYCDKCNDSDQLIFSSDNIKEVEDFLRKQANLFGSGGYDICYLNLIYKECAAILEEFCDL